MRFIVRGTSLVLLVLTVGCQQPASSPQAPPVPKVTVSRPIQRELTDVREFTGRTEAVEKVEVRARVKGFLEKIHFKEGAEVAKGDLLYEIDPKPFQAELEKAQAEVTRQQAQLKQATTEAERAARLRTNSAISEEE